MKVDGRARLDGRTVAHLSGDVRVPGYDRSRLSAGIVHVGVGGFHRAHQEVYLDRLLARGGPREWAVRGVGLLPGDADVVADLADQDHLYSVTQLHPDGRRETSVVGSLLHHHLAPDDPEAVLGAMADPSTRVVTLTVTEGGYGVDASGRLDPDTPGVADDLTGREAPRTVFGVVVEALARRRAAGTRPFTVVSCDNLPGNGQVARSAFTGYARLRDHGLAGWVEREVAFPSSMVDRITPATSEEDAAAVDEALGVHDARPVVTEPFTQWVLEDHFCAGRPPLEEVGVQVVADVEPYELMKLRLLNASHQVVSYLASLAGLVHVHEAFADPAFRGLVQRYLEREATPTLPEVPGVDLADYRATLLERFANSHVRDALARNCTDGSDRIPAFLLPVVRDRLRADGEVAVAALAVAGWARYLEGVDEAGRTIEVADRRRDRLVALAARSDEEPLAVLRATEELQSLAEDRRFVEAFTSARSLLSEVGARGAAESLLR